MVLPRGITIVEGVAPAAPRTPSSITIAVVGTVTGGASTAVDGVPTIVHNYEDATAAFGTAGTLIDAAKFAYHVWPEDPYFVGIKYDHTQTGQNLTDAITASVEALRQVGAITGHIPTYIPSMGLSKGSETETTANSLNTLFATIAEEVDATYFADAPLSASPDNASTAQAASLAWEANNSHNAQVTVSGKVTTGDVTSGHASGYMAGMAAHIRATQGIQETFSHQTALGVSSVSPRYTYNPRANVASNARTLDNAGISTIVSYRDRWMAFGGKTGYASTDQRIWYNKLQIVNSLDERIFDIAETLLDRELTPATVGNWVSLAQDRVIIPAIVDGTLLEGSSVVEDVTVGNNEAGLAVTYYLYQMGVAVRVTRQIAG